MAYSTVVREADMRRANANILENLRSADAEVFRNQKIVFRPSVEIADVFWLEEKGIWFAAVEKSDHFWFPIGLGKPDGRSLRITFELNTPTKSDHGRAGLFLQDNSNKVFLAHSGRIGGGVEGINRSTFLAHHGKQADVVQYDDSKEAILIGAADSSSTSWRIAEFTREIAAFKSLVKSGVPDAVAIQTSSTQALFKPKFIGRIKREKASEQQPAELLHDLVCLTLNALLPKPGGYFTRERDLYVSKPDGTISTLFEVKTDCTTTSIYTAVGQLLLNSNPQSGTRPNLVLVIPGNPNQSTAEALSSLGITVVSYRWNEDIPTFLPNCLSKITL